MYSTHGRESINSTKESNAPQQLPALVPLEVVFARHNLERYSDMFEKAGYKVFDIARHFTDYDIENMLQKVERSQRVTLPVHDRVALWKALRHAWHLGPGHHVPFISRAEVPRIFLPKLDFRMMDSEMKLCDIDPDRQRQIIRKRMEKAGPKGVAVQTIQFEVYQRQLDMVYELRDLKACLNEWQKLNPRRLYKEDSREEVLKGRIKHLSDFAGMVLQERKSVMNKSLQLAIVLVFIRIVSIFMVVLMVFTAYYRYRESPNELMLSFIIASGQFRSALAYFIAFWFCYVVAQRRKEDPLITRLRAMLIACERLQEQISDFRERTNDLRIAETNNRGQKDAQASKRQVRRRKKKRTKLERDDTMAALQLNSDIANTDGAINVKYLMKSLEESYKKLPPLQEGFERPGGGGDRMYKHDHRIGGNVEVANLRAPPKTTEMLALPIGRATLPATNVLRPRSESPTSSESLSPQNRGSGRVAPTASSQSFNFASGSLQPPLQSLGREASASHVFTSSKDTSLTR